MSVFSSPTGSPGCLDLDQTYPMSLSDDMRKDALHDLLERIAICEGLVSPNPWSGRETELQRRCTRSFINSLETQTQQQPSSQEEPDVTEQGVQQDMRVVTSVLIQLHKSVILEMTLYVTIPKPMTGTILIAR